MGERERKGVTDFQVALGKRTGVHSVHLTMAVCSAENSEVSGFSIDGG